MLSQHGDRVDAKQRDQSNAQPDLQDGSEPGRGPKQNQRDDGDHLKRRRHPRRRDTAKISPHVEYRQEVASRDRNAGSGQDDER